MYNKIKLKRDEEKREGMYNNKKNDDDTRLIHEEINLQPLSVVDKKDTYDDFFVQHK